MCVYVDCVCWDQCVYVYVVVCVVVEYQEGGIEWNEFVMQGQIIGDGGYVEFVYVVIYIVGVWVVGGD